MQILP